MKVDRILELRSEARHLWVFLPMGIVLVAYLIGLFLWDLLGAGYLRSLVQRLFGA